MKYSLAKESMTPDKSVFLAGFGGRDRKSEGVLDNLYIRVVLLQENQTLLLLTFDALGGDRSFASGIKNALYEKFGLKEDEILLNYSHTHCSVFLTGEDPDCRKGNYSMNQDRFPLLGEEVDYSEDIRFYHQLTEKIVASVQRCYETLREGELWLGTGKTEIAISRRLLTESGVQFRPNPEAEVDRDLTVMRLSDADGKVEGIIFSCGCHPTAMGGYQICAEFPGQACRYLDELYPDSTAVFLQGCGADLKPAYGVEGNSFKTCNMEEIEQIGSELGKTVDDLIKRNQLTRIHGPFSSRLANIRLYTEIWEASIFEKMLLEEKSEYTRAALRRLIKAIQENTDKKSLPYSISVWHLGETVKIIAMEGEVPTELSLTMKRLFHEYQTVVLGYSNSVMTYIPTRKILREGGYEAEAYVLHGYRGPFLPETEDMILGAAVRIGLLND